MNGYLTSDDVRNIVITQWPSFSKCFPRIVGWYKQNKCFYKWIKGLKQQYIRSKGKIDQIVSMPN